MFIAPNNPQACAKYFNICKIYNTILLLDECTEVNVVMEHVEEDCVLTLD